MKKSLLILAIFFSTRSFSQSISTDSLSAMINRMQKQINVLQNYIDTISFAPGQATVISVRPTNHLISINNYAAMAAGGTSSVLAIKDSIGIEALKVKIAGLKATTII